MRPASTVSTFALRLGPLAWLLALSAYKAHDLQLLLAGNGTTFLYVWQGDLKTFVVATSLVLAASVSRQRWIRMGLGVLLALLALLFVADTLTVLFFDVRPTWRDWSRIREVLDARSFLLKPLTLLSLLGGVVAMMVSFRVTRRRQIATSVFGGFALLAAFFPSSRPQSQAKYHASVLQSVWRDTVQAESPAYPLREAAAAYATWRREPAVAAFGGRRPNLILIIIESLSAVDSQKTSGLGNLWPRFDAMAADGSLFVNFMSAGRSSIDALIAIFGGILPCHYPGLDAPDSTTFKNSGVFLHQLKARGYFTSYVTGWDLPQKISWFPLQEYLSANGVDQAIGRSDPFYRGLPAINYMPPDKAVFDLARKNLDARSRDGRPFFMTIATVSSHPPYEATAESRAAKQDPRAFIMSYVDGEVGRFYDGLKATHFLDEGILMILGDHRHWGPLTPAEETRYGDSAIARVPLLVVGAGIPRGTVDRRFFQQQDLLRQLDQIAKPEATLTKTPIFVEYTTSRDNLSVFSTGDQARRRQRLSLSAGRDMSWSGTPPLDAPQIEAALHRQRAALQHLNTLTLPATSRD
jgi:hypothetical protein